MALKQDLEDRAVSEAKRTDWTQVAVIHVACALAAVFAPELVTRLRDIARQTRREIRASGPLTLSAEAKELLERCTGPDEATEELRQLTRAFGVHAPVTDSTQSQRDYGAAVDDEREVTIDQVLAEFDQLVGLEGVKDQVQKLLALHKANQLLEESGRKQIPSTLHLVFTGSPGTGKTTVARLVARLYKAAGLLPSGHLVETDRAGLVGEAVGTTAQKVMKVVNAAKGGVLFIDEAYALAQDLAQGYGAEAISTLVKAMEDRRGSLAVIVAGYPNEMEKFIAANPGLKSRFQTYINFPDYSAEEMLEMFGRISAEHNIDSTAVSHSLRNYFQAQRLLAAAGNGRLVRNTFQSMFERAASRANSDGTMELHELIKFESEDVPHSTGNQTVDEILEELDQLVGLEVVKEQLRSFLAIHDTNLALNSAGQKTIPHSLHMVFTGAPGTGKTTVARIVGKLFRAKGLLPTGELTETDRSGLIGEYVGWTNTKVNELLHKANGGVLFIDEAYALVADESGHDFGTEAIAALVKGMEELRQSLAVIVAGYENEMKRFIDSNPGLKSRFQTTIHFPDYSASEMVEIFRRISHQYGIDSSKVLPTLHEYFTELARSKDAGNGRLVRNTFEAMMRGLSRRAAEDGNIELHELNSFAPEDIPQLSQRNSFGFTREGKNE